MWRAICRCAVRGARARVCNRPAVNLEQGGKGEMNPKQGAPKRVVNLVSGLTKLV